MQVKLDDLIHGLCREAHLANANFILAQRSAFMDLLKDEYDTTIATLYQTNADYDYVTLDDYALLEQAHVAVVPGNDSGFETHVRFSFATSMQNIDKGIDRLAEFLKKPFQGEMVARAVGGN